MMIPAGVVGIPPANAPGFVCFSRRDKPRSSFRRTIFITRLSPQLMTMFTAAVNGPLKVALV